MLNYTIKGFLLIAIPFIVFAALLSGPLLTLFANSTVAQNAYMVTPVIALATLFFGLNIILSNVLLVRMKTSVILKMNTLAAIINLGLNILFLQVFKNVLVAAVTTLIGYLLVFIFVRRAVSADWPVYFEAKTIIRSIAASLFMGFCLYLISWYLGDYAYNAVFILAQIFAGIVIYVLSLLTMKTLSRKELAYLKTCFS